MMNQLRKLLYRLFKPLTPYYERVSDATSPAIAQLRARYQKLESRERTLVKIAGIVVGLFFVYNFIYMPIATWRDSIDTTLDTRRHQIGEVQHLVETYLGAQKTAPGRGTQHGAHRQGFFAVLRDRGLADQDRRA